MQKLIKINTDHYVVVDNSQIKEGDWVLMDNKWVVQVYDFEDGYWGIKNDPGSVHNSNIKKITHSTQPMPHGVVREGQITGVTAISLQEVKELIGDVDVEKRFQDILNTETPQEMDIMLLEATKHGFKYGYNQALEDNKEKKYTEEDLLHAFREGVLLPNSQIGIMEDIFKQVIQSLNKQD